MPARPFGPILPDVVGSVALRVGAVFEALTGDPKNEYLMLDTTLVRAHQQAATGKGGQRIRLWGASEAD